MTPIEPISDEKLAELEQSASHEFFSDEDDAAVMFCELRGLIARLRAAEADAKRLNKLDSVCEAYGFEGIHEGNRWMIDGPYRDIRAAVDDMPERTP